MHIVCSDLEGVFVPEIWINVARITGIDELRLTTRDIADYNVLMRKRLGILDANGRTSSGSSPPWNRSVGRSPSSTGCGPAQG